MAGLVRLNWAMGYRAGSFAQERYAEMEQYASLLAVGI
jgi:hypothetical protein